MKKLISICVPCYNEVENVQQLSEELIKQLEQFPQYDFEIIFIDNCSIDGTQKKLRDLCKNDRRIKVILNAQNYIYTSSLYVMYQAKGDCIISFVADFQIPVELVSQSIIEWEKGAKAVIFLKKPGAHDKYRLFRKLYYKLSSLFSNNLSIAGFTGAGLYDKSFFDTCKALNDPLFSITYMVLHHAYPLVRITYDEQARRSGKSSNSFFRLINIAILKFTRISDLAPHYAIVIGLIMGLASFLISIYYLVRKLIDWDHFPVGVAPLVIGMFFLGSLQLIFIGLIGEYVLQINERQKSKNRPLVTEKERINFDEH